MTILRKTRSDSKLHRLTPEQKDAAFAHCEAVKLEEGVQWLKAEMGIQISVKNLCVWLQRQRLQRSMAGPLKRIADDRDRATLVGDVVGMATEITEANIALISQAVFEEFREPAEKRDEKRLAKYMTLALKAREQGLKSRAIDLAFNRFHFDAARRARECVAELQEINKGDGDEREKIERAMKLLFGERPEGIAA